MELRKAGIASLILVAVAFGLALAQKDAEPSPPKRPDPPEIVTREGTISGMDRPHATFQSEGVEYRLHLGPIWFWEEKGYRLAKGDEVTVTGEIERYGSQDHIFPRVIERDGETYRLTDDNGTPLWYGHGRGGRRGWAGAGRGGCGGWHHHGDCGDCPHHPCADPGCPHR